jgi:hypothetical protein
VLIAILVVLGGYALLALLCLLAWRNRFRRQQPDPDEVVPLGGLLQDEVDAEFAAIVAHIGDPVDAHFDTLPAGRPEGEPC